MLAVLVTGSRDWADVSAVHSALCGAGPDIVIHGGCGTGADFAAAEYEGCLAVPMPAQWDQHGKGAGPRRNAEMVKLLQCLKATGYDVAVHAFPQGPSPGTRGCMKLAAAAGFRIVNHEETRVGP